MAEILHITSSSAWAASQDQSRHVDPSLESEGFIHCSEAHQVLGPANRLYQSRTDLVLLKIDTERLSKRLVYEDSYGHGSFPHVYGPINLDAVVDVVPFPCGDDGSFSLPPALT